MAALAALLAGPACGPGNPFTNLFPDNRESDVNMVLARLPDAATAGRSPTTSGKPVVVATRLGDPPGLVAYDVAAKAVLWSVDVAVDSPPFVGGGVAVVQSGGELVSFSLASGERLGERSLDGLVLYGVAIDGGMVAATAGSGAGSVAASFRSGRIWLMDEELANVVAPMDADKLLGAPALAGGVAFIPWDRQNVSALDAATGGELFRLVIGDEMISYVFAVPEGVFYGSKGVFRLTGRSSSGRRDGSAYLPIEWSDPSFPGEPELWPDGFAGAGDGKVSARSRARLTWYPGAVTDDRKVAFADGLLYFVYYRYVVAMRPEDRSLVWVRGLDGTASEVAAVPGGVFVVEESGKMRFLRAADGGDAWTGELGVGVARAGIAVAGWDPGAGAPREGTHRRQVLDALLDPDAQVVPVRKLILSLFGRSTDPDVSRDLLQVLREPQMPAELRNEAAHALQLRAGGDAFLIQALADHYDFLQDVPAPPVGVIAGALRSMNARGAATALAAHLLDPNTPPDTMEGLVRSVVALGDSAVVPPLQTFFRLYGADTEFAGAMPVLEAAATGIAVHGGERGLEFLEQWAVGPFAPPGLARSVTAIVENRRLLATALQGLPERADAGEFAAAVTGGRDAYASCLADAKRRRPMLAHVEVSITVTGEGQVVDVMTTPADSALANCLKPLVERLSLPRFRAQQERYAVPLDLE
ncbi:MAG: PQQ-binding-like beta-propeller repeat protein [Deltaproteobacteria bacterium]|nr:PQQ-binding-like beta-propeller repeat protein [Deltaproteobacteria bacterium]